MAIRVVSYIPGMKKSTLLLCALLLGCNRYGADRQAITAVMAAKAQAEVTATHTKKAGPWLDEREFLPLLHNISTTNCPRDFRLAWIDFVHSHDALVASYGPKTAINLLALVHLDAKPMADTLAATDVSSYWRNVEHCAVAHGVEFKESPQ